MNAKKSRLGRMADITTAFFKRTEHQGLIHAITHAPITGNPKDDRRIISADEYALIVDLELNTWFEWYGLTISEEAVKGLHTTIMNIARRYAVEDVCNKELKPQS